MYSIKTIAALTGLGTETLRAWERRYRAIVPGRDEGGRRSYSQQDLERLTLLANLTRQGHAISKVSGLDVEQLRKLLNAGGERVVEQRLFAEQIVDALRDYRIDHCEQLLKRALIANEPLAYVRDILAPALNHVGQLWHDEKLSVAQEHMFSACVKRILLSMVNNLQGLFGNRPSMLFATPSGEPHEFGILMCCLLAAEQHYDCYYLGANVPAADLIDAALKLKADVLVLSLPKTPPDAETLADLNSVVTAMGEEKVAIWLGGKGADYWQAQQQALPKNCEFIADLDHFHARARQRRNIG
ncbi:MAG: MerR family transcriptional regulator [Methylococcaceae bacterium]|nr:MerR family transcriptional regulator [Methylococcaceae bacterium]